KDGGGGTSRDNGGAGASQTIRHQSSKSAFSFSFFKGFTGGGDKKEGTGSGTGHTKGALSFGGGGSGSSRGGNRNGNNNSHGASSGGSRSNKNSGGGGSGSGSKNDKLHRSGTVSSTRSTLRRKVAEKRSPASSTVQGGNTTPPSSTVGAGSGSKRDGIGSSLDEPVVPGPPDVPLILRKCISLLDDIALETEGLYRISGSAITLERLRRLFEQDPTKVHLRPPPPTSPLISSLSSPLVSDSKPSLVRRASRLSLTETISSARSSMDLSMVGAASSSVGGGGSNSGAGERGGRGDRGGRGGGSDSGAKGGGSTFIGGASLYDNDVHVLTGVVKSYLREGLPPKKEPLCTFELYEAFITAAQLDDWRTRMIAIQDLIHGLPPVYFETMRFICEHLSRVSQRCEANRMSVRNLAIIFGPTLFRPPPALDSLARVMRDMPFQCTIVEVLVEHCDWVFGPIEFEEAEEYVDGVLVEGADGGMFVVETAYEDNGGAPETDVWGDVSVEGGQNAAGRMDGDLPDEDGSVIDHELKVRSERGQSVGQHYSGSGSRRPSVGTLNVARDDASMLSTTPKSVRGLGDGMGGDVSSSYNAVDHHLASISEVSSDRMDEGGEGEDGGQPQVLSPPDIDPDVDVEVSSMDVEISSAVGAQSTVGSIMTTGSASLAPGMGPGGSRIPPPISTSPIGLNYSMQSAGVDDVSSMVSAGGGGGGDRKSFFFGRNRSRSSTMNPPSSPTLSTREVRRRTGQQSLDLLDKPTGGRVAGGSFDLADTTRGGAGAANWQHGFDRRRGNRVGAVFLDADIPSFENAAASSDVGGRPGGMAGSHPPKTGGSGRRSSYSLHRSSAIPVSVGGTTSSGGSPPSSSSTRLHFRKPRRSLSVDSHASSTLKSNNSAVVTGVAHHNSAGELQLLPTIRSGVESGGSAGVGGVGTTGENAAGENILGLDFSTWTPSPRLSLHLDLDLERTTSFLDE
ncbi:hypothetical protein HK102_013509, partial [Quaeritorhiza haematococci]